MDGNYSYFGDRAQRRVVHFNEHRSDSGSCGCQWSAASVGIGLVTVTDEEAAATSYAGTRRSRWAAIMGRASRSKSANRLVWASSSSPDAWANTSAVSIRALSTGTP